MVRQPPGKQKGFQTRHLRSFCLAGRFTVYYHSRAEIFDRASTGPVPVKNKESLSSNTYSF